MTEAGSVQRFDFVDYAKGICILLVVLIHVGFASLMQASLFVMPFFFAATGYTFSYGKRSARENIARRFRSVMIPYFFLMAVSTLLEMLRAPLFGYGDASIALPSLANTVYGSGILPFDGGVFDTLKQIVSYKAQPQTGVDLILPLNCHLWFLPATFVAYVLFVLLVRPFRRNAGCKALILSGLVLVAAAESVLLPLRQLPFGIGRGAMGAAFMLFGFWLRDEKRLEFRSVPHTRAANLLSAVLFVGAILLGSDGSGFVRSEYGPYGLLSVLLTLIGGFAGIRLLLSVCRGLERLNLRPIKAVLSDLGKRIMTVYAWHMAVKFALDAVYLRFLRGGDVSLLDEYKMGLTPQDSLWFMLFETVATISLCLALSRLRNKRPRA